MTALPRCRGGVAESPSHLCTARATGTIDRPLFTLADVRAGQDRMAGVIAELLRRRSAPHPDVLPPPETLLDPAWFVYFSSPHPPFPIAAIPTLAAARPVPAGCRTGVVAAAPSGHWPLLDDWADSIDWDLTRSSAAALGPAVARALALLRLVQPRLAEAVEATTRVVVTFVGGQPNSFAARSAHGAVFLNCRPGDDLAYAVEELAHQGGHVLLTSILFGSEPSCFVVPPEAPLVPGDDGDDRTVLVGLHAVFTEALMTAALWACLHGPGLSRLERHEVRGRLAYILYRFRLDLTDLLSAPVLSATGLDLVDRCRRVHDEAVERWAVSAPRLDLSGQPYTFDRGRFLARNPTPAGADVEDGGPPVRV